MAGPRAARFLLTVVLAFLLAGCEQSSQTARPAAPAPVTSAGDGLVVGQIGRCIGPTYEIKARELLQVMAQLNAKYGGSANPPRDNVLQPVVDQLMNELFAAPHPAGTVVVLRGSPTETAVTSAWVRGGGEFSFFLPPGQYLLVANDESGNPLALVGVSVAAGQVTRSNVPDCGRDFRP